MKKTPLALTIAVVVAAGSWLGSTWYTGKHLEAESPVRIAQLNAYIDQQLPGSGIKVEQLEFNRGFFSSHARYGISAVGPDHDKGRRLLPPGLVEIDVDAEHGPFPWEALKRGNVLPSAAFTHTELARTDGLKDLFALTQGKPLFSGDNIISYSGGGRFDVRIAPASMSGDTGKFDFSGAALQGTYEPSTRAMKAEMNMALLSFEEQLAQGQAVRHGSGKAEGLTLKIDTRQGKFGLYTGRQDFQLKRVVIQGKDMAAPVSLDDIHASGAGSETGKTVAAEAVYAVGKVRVGDIDLGQLSFAAKLAGLDGAATGKLAAAFRERNSAQLRQALASKVAGAGDADDESGLDDDEEGDAPARMSSLQPLVSPADLRAVLSGAPKVSIGPLLWKNAKGESQIIATLDLAQPSEAAMAPDAGQQFLREMLKSATVQVSLSQPMMQEAMARYLGIAEGMQPAEAEAKAEKSVNDMVTMGSLMNLVANKDDALVSDITYADGTVKVNGREIPSLARMLNLGG